MANKTGDIIPEFLIQQLTQREKVNTKKGEDAQKVYKLSSNSAWVKLRSSINRIDESSIPAGKSLKEVLLKREEAFNINTLPDIAESFVLIGGTQATNSQPRAGISTAPNTNTTSKAYNNYSNEYGLGFRPMPGITGVSITSKGTYGTTIEAVVDFKVFSVEDLEICELLYFRPGFTALLEWGHTAYLDNNGNVIYAGPSSTISDRDFFTPNTMCKIDTLIRNLRVSSAGNYDGLFGFITNFSFSLNKDGSYNCQVKILSRGVILEGLKPSKTTDHTTNEEEEEKEEDNRKYKSIYHYIFDKLADGNPIGEFKLADHLKKKKETHLASTVPDITVFGYKTDIKGHYLGDEVDEIPVHYMTLGSFLKLVNVFNFLGDPRKKKIPQTPSDCDSSSKDYVPFSADNLNTFNTFPDHISVDPIVALPPKKPTGETKYINGVKGPTNFFEGFLLWAGFKGVFKSAGDIYKECFIDDISEKMEAYAQANGGTDLINNIFISTFAIEKTLDDLVTGEQDENTGMYEFVTRVLSSVQAALGEVNELSLFYDHDINRYIVVDRGVKPPGTIPVINMTGLKSTVYDIKIDSTISKAVATQVAIAAQGNSGNYKENLETLLQWNRGAVDRHMPIRHTDDAEKDDDSAEKKSKYLKKLVKFWGKFNDRGIVGGLFTNQDYETEVIESLRSELNADMQSLSKYYSTKNGTTPGVVPVELSFDMQGIHGFIIGTTFKINKGLLPSKYDNWAFIVTGISHSIGGDNRWKTSIKTQFFPDRTGSGTPSTNLSLDENELPNRTAPTVGEEATLGDIETTNHPNANRLRETLSTLGFSEKGQEISNGGDISNEAANMGISIFTTIKREIPGISLIVTGGNDIFHQKLPYNSRHKKGTGLDFVISPNTPQYLKNVETILKGYAVGNNPKFRYINEYDNPTKAASGRHFHISWGTGTESQKVLDKALAEHKYGKLKKTYTV